MSVGYYDAYGEYVSVDYIGFAHFSDWEPKGQAYFIFSCCICLVAWAAALVLGVFDSSALKRQVRRQGGAGLRWAALLQCNMPASTAPAGLRWPACMLQPVDAPNQHAPACAVRPQMIVGSAGQAGAGGLKNDRREPLMTAPVTSTLV